MSDQLYSTDADIYLHQPKVFRAFPDSLQALAEGSDGATSSTGKVFTSASYSAWASAGVGEDGLGNETTHFLEIVSGTYQGTYRITDVTAGNLTLDRAIAASQTGLVFRIRTFDKWHVEAHKHYQDHILRLERLERDADSGEWDDTELHGRSQRLLRDLCVYRVLAIVCKASRAAKDDLWDLAGKEYAAKEAAAMASISDLELDTDGDGQADERTSENFGSIQAEIG